MSDLISEKEFLKLVKLANFDMEEDEIDGYRFEVSEILKMIDKLKSINTENVKPTYQVSGNSNIMREDLIDDEKVDAETLMQLAPENENGQLKVGKVL